MQTLTATEAMRRFYAERLLRTMDATALAAQHAGFTPQRLEELLTDDDWPEGPCEARRC